jgi:hypothetical protein
MFIGAVALGYLAIVKFVMGEDIGGRPLLMVGILCVIGAVQFITTGVVTELVARAWMSSPDAHSYVVHESRAGRAGESDWG